MHRYTWTLPDDLKVGAAGVYKKPTDGRPVMVVTSTNKALVEIASRVMECVAQATKRSEGAYIRMVLVGDEDKLFSVTDAVNKECLREHFIYGDHFEQLRQNYQTLLNQVNTSTEKELEKEMLQVAREQQKRLRCYTAEEKWLKLAADIVVHLEKLQAGKENLSALKKSKRAVVNAIETLNTILGGIDQTEAEQSRLQHSQIIFCTLSSSGSRLFRSTDTRKILISDLILDEAASSSETELAIPMLLQPRRMICVGDQKQLPAMVLSQHANYLGLGQSLHDRFDSMCPNSMLMLKTQYRMDPMISSFPSRHFYQGKIKDDVRR